MNLEIIRTQTTWNDAAGSINSNYAKIADAIALLKANGGGGGSGADIDLTAYATKVWVEAKGYITASTLTPYALKTDIPSLVGYATEDFVNNKLGDYATKDYVTTKLVDYAPLTSVQGFENRIAGLEGAVPQLNERVDSNDEQIAILNETTSGHTTSIGTLTQRVDSVEQLAATKLDSSYFTLTNIKSTLGISDWALAAIKPSYTASEVGATPSLGNVGANSVKGNGLGYTYATSAHGGQTAGGFISFGNTSYGCQLNGSIYGGELAFRGLNNGTFTSWKILAFTDSNVASATKLQTPRTLWGKSFDGTDNVSGDINNAAGGIYIHNTNEINSFQGKLFLNHRGSGQTGYGSTNDIVMVANGGNVGIGTTAITEKLDVAGNIKARGNINATSITINGVTITASNGSITVNGNVLATGDITGGV